MNHKDGILVGIDLGGTNVRTGAVSPDGQLLYMQETPIQALLGPDVGIQRIILLVEDVLAQVNRPVIALGLGSTGPLDRQRGCIQNPYTLPGWEDVDVVSPLQARFGVPVAFENDADAAALGEAWIGAGQGVSRMAMVTIGTGVGTALILAGKIYRGLGGEHPEGGHIIIDPSGPECYCGGRGCWESLVAGPAIARYAREADGARTSPYLQSIPGGLDAIDAAAVFAGARLGDLFCKELVDRTADYITLGLVSIIMLTLPDCIVLTGGVIRSYDLLEDRIRAGLLRHNIIVPAQRVNIQLSRLGQQAGVYGAARAAWLLSMDDQP